MVALIALMVVTITLSDVMGPGGFRFADYWRMGLPLELVVLLVAVPMLLLVWPL